MPTFSRKLQPLGDLAQDQPRDVPVGLRQLDLARSTPARARADSAQNSSIARARRRAPRATPARSRAPSQTGHGRSDMYSSIFSRVHSESVSR